MKEIHTIEASALEGALLELQRAEEEARRRMEPYRLKLEQLRQEVLAEALHHKEMEPPMTDAEFRDLLDELVPPTPEEQEWAMQFEALDAIHTIERVYERPQWEVHIEQNNVERFQFPVLSPVSSSSVTAN